MHERRARRPRGGEVRVAAVDLGASSGRVIAVTVGPDTLRAVEVHRFPNEPVLVGGVLSWDAAALLGQVERGLAAAAATGPVDAVGIDSWAVDYGLLDASGRLLADPACYRDDRTVGVPERVWDRLDRAGLYRITGVQHQRFNTVFQLAAEPSSRLAAARRLLLVPDLLGHLLTGAEVTEVTNASTTGLLDARTRTWSPAVLRAAGVPDGLLAPLVEPGTVIGGLTADAAARTGLPAGTPVVAVGSHDTASAVAGVPALGDDFAYVSSGTWSLVGLELPAPVLTDEGRASNATNELGVDGTVRYLRNTTGLWLLQECQRHWGAHGEESGLATLLDAAAREPRLRWLVDADDERFLAPGDMPARLAAVAAERGAAPATPAQVVRCILDSLAVACARSVARLARLADHPVRTVHVVGGGSRNRLLCRLTADACGLPVVAGPAEAAALGNAMVQARALGALAGDLAALRRLVAATQPLGTYLPSADRAAWLAAVATLDEVAPPDETAALGETATLGKTAALGKTTPPPSRRARQESR